MKEVNLKTKKKVNTIAVILFFGIVFIGLGVIAWFLRSGEKEIGEALNQPLTEGTTTTQSSQLKTCVADSDCPLNYICYNSLFCGLSDTKAADCDIQIGDLKCHKQCVEASDCELDQDCLEVTLWQGEQGREVSICL